MAQPRSDPYEGDPTGRGLAAKSSQLELAANIAWNNYVGAVAAVVAGNASEEAPTRALVQYRSARALQVAADEELAEHNRRSR